MKFVVELKLPDDFPFDIEGNKITVAIELPIDYPSTPATFSLRNARIPAVIRQCVCLVVTFSIA